MQGYEVQQSYYRPWNISGRGLTERDNLQRRRVQRDACRKMELSWFVQWYFWCRGINWKGSVGKNIWCNYCKTNGHSYSVCDKRRNACYICHISSHHRANECMMVWRGEGRPWGENPPKGAAISVVEEGKVCHTAQVVESIEVERLKTTKRNNVASDKKEKRSVGNISGYEKKLVVIPEEEVSSLEQESMVKDDEESGLVVLEEQRKHLERKRDSGYSSVSSDRRESVMSSGSEGENSVFLDNIVVNREGADDEIVAKDEIKEETSSQENSNTVEGSVSLEEMELEIEGLFKEGLSTESSGNCEKSCDEEGKDNGKKMENLVRENEVKLKQEAGQQEKEVGKGYVDEMSKEERDEWLREMRIAHWYVTVRMLENDIDDEMTLKMLIDVGRQEWGDKTFEQVRRMACGIAREFGMEEKVVVSFRKFVIVTHSCEGFRKANEIRREIIGVMVMDWYLEESWEYDYYGPGKSNSGNEEFGYKEERMKESSGAIKKKKRKPRNRKKKGCYEQS